MKSMPYLLWSWGLILGNMFYVIAAEKSVNADLSVTLLCTSLIMFGMGKLMEELEKKK